MNCEPRLVFMLSKKYKSGGINFIMDEETRKILVEVRDDLEKIREAVARGQSMTYFDENELLNIAFEITNLVNHATSKLSSVIEQKRNRIFSR